MSNLLRIFLNPIFVIYYNHHDASNMKTIWTLFFLMLSFSIFCQNNWYINQQNGSNNNDGLSPSTPFETIDYATGNNVNVEPGDTILLMGLFTNSSYNPDYEFTGNIGDPYIWTQENTVRINNLHGAVNHYITLKSYDENTLLRGSGGNIFRLFNCSYLRVEGFEIYGEVENIPLSTAEALQFLYKDASGIVQYRVQSGTPPEEVENMTFPILENIQRPSYTDTRGIYLSNSDHIDLLNNLVHHTPGNGFRVANSDYINVIGNEVHNTSRKSYSGTHGLVVSNSKSIDNNTEAKIFILRNKVHHNYNEIYSWAPTKTIITPYIDEGKGISLQRNDLENTWTFGRIRVENNLTYLNGYSGLHSNGGRGIDFINNTSYFDSFTGGGNNHGISLQSSEDVLIINNIVFQDVAQGGNGIAASNSSTNYTVKNNLINGVINANVDEVDENTIFADPLFVDPEIFDFNLQEGSPAIGAALEEFAPDDDFLGMQRLNDPDLGALESPFLTSISSMEDQPAISVFPNPFNTFLIIESEKELQKINLYDLLGRAINDKISINVDAGNLYLNTSRLELGTYILKIGNAVTLVSKLSK